MGERAGYNPPNIDGMVTLKVDNIHFRADADEIRAAFDRFGDIGDVYLPREKSTGEPRGFAFVRFIKKEDAEEAMQAMDGQDLNGRQLRIQFALQKRPDNPREYYSQRRRQYSPPRRRRDSRSPVPRYRSRSPPRRERRRSRSYEREPPPRRSRSPDRRRRRDSHSPY